MSNPCKRHLMIGPVCWGWLVFQLAIRRFGQVPHMLPIAEGKVTNQEQNQQDDEDTYPGDDCDQHQELLYQVQFDAIIIAKDSLGSASGKRSQTVESTKSNSLQRWQGDVSIVMYAPSLSTIKGVFSMLLHRKIIITGAASGIGKELVKQC